MSALPDPAAAPAIDPGPLEAIRQVQRPGGPDLVQRIVSLFLKEAPARVDALIEGLRRGDAASAARAAHALKSACGNVGALRLSAICRDVEALARDDRISDASAHIEELSAEFARARAALQAL